jgi:hypothetical protein
MIHRRLFCVVGQLMDVTVRTASLVLQYLPHR